MTPEMVHYGQAAKGMVQRQVILRAAYETHPERMFKGYQGTSVAGDGLAQPAK